jgi:hypothetical protein
LAIEQAQVGDQVLFVITGHNGGGRCFVGDIRVKRGRGASAWATFEGEILAT